MFFADFLHLCDLNPILTRVCAMTQSMTNILVVNGCKQKRERERDNFLAVIVGGSKRRHISLMF